MIERLYNNGVGQQASVTMRETGNGGYDSSLQVINTDLGLYLGGRGSRSRDLRTATRQFLSFSLGLIEQGYRPVETTAGGLD